jgi:predicted SnoaL-like aldol condensation-catalyzing enzyme
MAQESAHAQNKQLVTSFLRTAFHDKKPRAAAAAFLGTYRQHNPTAADGAENFVKYAEGMIKQFPKMSYDVKRTLQDGDYVVVHAKLQTDPGDRGTAVVDIFRCHNGRIVEHWDVMQPIPEKSANANTMF